MKLPEIIVYLQQEELFPNVGIISEAKFEELIESVFADTAD